MKNLSDLDSILSEAEKILNQKVNSIDSLNSFFEEKNKELQGQNESQNVQNIVKTLVERLLLEVEENKKIKKDIIREKEKTALLIRENEGLYLDSLTQLYNRHKYNIDTHYLLMEYKEKLAPFSFAFLDLDYFKNVNDTYGHSVGDKVLKIFAALLKRIETDQTKMYRFGGEEFVVLHEGKKEELYEKINKIKTFLNGKLIKHNKERIKVTFSAGITETKEGDDDIILLEERADSLLYKSKEEGRDRINM